MFDALAGSLADLCGSGREWRALAVVDRQLDENKVDIPVEVTSVVKPQRHFLQPHPSAPVVWRCQQDKLLDIPHRCGSAAVTTIDLAYFEYEETDILTVFSAGIKDQCQRPATT